MSETEALLVHQLIRDLNCEKGVVAVEGKRDAAALTGLGFAGMLMQFHRYGGFARFADAAVLYPRVILMDKYANRPATQYGVTPLEMAMLSILYHKKDGLDIDGMHQAVSRFAPSKRRVAQLLNRLAHAGLVGAVSDGGAAA